MFPLPHLLTCLRKCLITFLGQVVDPVINNRDLSVCLSVYFQCPDLPAEKLIRRGHSASWQPWCCSPHPWGGIRGSKGSPGHRNGGPAVPGSWAPLDHLLSLPCLDLLCSDASGVLPAECSAGWAGFLGGGQTQALVPDAVPGKLGSAAWDLCFPACSRLQTLACWGFPFGLHFSCQLSS